MVGQGGTVIVSSASQRAVAREVRATVRVSQSGGGGGGIPYSGPYEATPTQETQTFATSGKVMRGDFVVNPIPSNYGLITWDGNVLTVS